MHGVRQLGVGVKSLFTLPARMDVEGPRIASAAEGVDAEAARFSSGVPHDNAEGFRDGAFASGGRPEFGETEKLQGVVLQCAT
jgi:hypothetical protein